MPLDGDYWNIKTHSNTTRQRQASTGTDVRTVPPTVPCLTYAQVSSSDSTSNTDTDTDTTSTAPLLSGLSLLQARRCPLSYLIQLERLHQVTQGVEEHKEEADNDSETKTSNHVTQGVEEHKEETPDKEESSDDDDNVPLPLTHFTMLSNPPSFVFDCNLDHILTSLLGLDLSDGGNDNMHVKMFHWQGITSFYHFEVIRPRDFRNFTYHNKGAPITNCQPIPSPTHQALADELHFCQDLVTANDPN